MKRCSACRVTVRGDKSYCPLCQLPLQGNTDIQGDYFPLIPPRADRGKALRWGIFATVVILLLIIPLSQMLPRTRLSWPRLVILGVFTMWVVFLYILRKRHNIAKTIVWLIAILSGLTVLWDYMTDWRGWSLEIAIPSIILGAYVALFITTRILHLEPGDYVVYFVLAAVMGAIPFIFLITGLLHFAILARITIAIGMMFMAYTVIFRWTSLKQELEKRMHV